MHEGDLQERLLPKLLAMSEERLDPNAIAAYVDGSLAEEERAALEARIAADPEASLLVRTLREERRRRTAIRWTLPAMAAVVLLALGLWWAEREDRSPAPTLEARLASSAAALRARDPEALGTFAPLDLDAAGEEPAVTRAGGGAWIAPVGVLLEAPRELRWRNPRGATRVEVAVEGAGTRWRGEVEGERADAPALAPGRYVVRLRALDTLAGQEIRRSFVVADEETRARHARAFAAIRADAPEDLRALLAAHYALENRLFVEARAALADAPRTGAEAARAVRRLETLLDAEAAPER